MARRISERMKVLAQGVGRSVTVVGDRKVKIYCPDGKSDEIELVAKSVAHVLRVQYELEWRSIDLAVMRAL